jgi:arylsulfatase A-like enzyme
MRPLHCPTIFVLLVAIHSVWQVGSTCADDSLNGPPRPNIVWIMSEDNSVHYLDHFFPGGADTPTIKQLAADGITFRRAYSNAPVCSVARTTLITSCYAPRLGTQYHRRNQRIQLPEAIKMFPAYLRQAGYYTTNNSKEDYNASGNEEAWDQSSRKASWRNRPRPDTPFFHVQTFTDSHESSLHFDQNTFQTEKTSHDPASVTPHPYLPDTPLVRYTHARYLDRMQAIDKQVAKVVKQLKEDGVWDSTVIFYFGDHGGVLPRSKGYAYDTGLHVPLVVRVPPQFQSNWNITAGSDDDRFVEFVDFGPTVLSLASVAIPDSVDGAPFLGPATADATQFQTALGYADRFDEKYDLVRSLHKGNFHYIRNYQPFYADGLYNEYRYKMMAYQQWNQLYRDGKLDDVQSAFFRPRPAEMLFDLSVDPFETNNLAQSAAHADTLASMRRELTSRLKLLPDLSFLTEPVCVPAAAANPVQYAQSQAKRIAMLIDIADTSLAMTDSNKELLRSAVDSEDPLQRFWAATSIGSMGLHKIQFGNGLSSIDNEIVELDQKLANDENGLVRSRAIEARDSAGSDSLELLQQCLNDSRSELEALWILNGIVKVRDGGVIGRPSDEPKFNSPFRGGEIDRRLNYLNKSKPQQ